MSIIKSQDFGYSAEETAARKAKRAKNATVLLIAISLSITGAAITLLCTESNRKISEQTESSQSAIVEEVDQEQEDNIYFDETDISDYLEELEENHQKLKR